MTTMDETTSATAYRDPTQPVDERVEDLLERMTLEEKVAQLTGILPFDLLGPAGLDEQKFDEHLADGIGEISAGALLSPDPARLVSMLDRLQRYLVEQTRLGIPAIVHHEALAGLVHQACADFPTAITLAASWDPPSVEAMNDVVRRQMRALGIHQACSPNLDLARDARWGRVQETYGEDPYLGSAIGVAFIRGLQGVERREGVLATAKHFLGYAMAYGGRNIGAVQMGERELLEVYARPFGAAIAEAGLESVMCAYSDLNGEPAAASRRLLTDMLRGTLGFRGLTVADYGAVNALCTRQRTAVDAADAGVQALEAGLDVELPGSICYHAGVARAVRDGVLDEAVVDRSVRLVLDAKFRLGLFEDPYGDVDAFAATIDDVSQRATRSTARLIATRSTVLLANPNRALPLARDLARVAVIGPNARSIRNLFGGYSAPAAIEMMTSGDMALPPVLGGELDDEQVEAPAREENSVDEPAPGTSGGTGDDFGFVRRIATHPSERALAAIEAVYTDTLTVFDSIRAVVADGTEVVYALGCDVNDPSTEGIAEAVDAAVGSDVAILVLGDKTGLVSDAMIGETRDRSTLELAGAQRPLLEAVCATGVPVIVVLLGSQPQPVLAEDGGPAAVVHAYQPGSVGGVAIADVLFGVENPSGRVPITIPRTAGQCPIYHGYKSGSDPSTYTDLDDSGPAYAFGHGLSYTTFEYMSIDVDAAEVDAGGSVNVDVRVANTGDRFGDEVVQLYASIRRRGVTRPVQELVGFHRVSLEAGDEAIVTFTLEPAILAYYDIDMNLVVTPGEVRLMAGPSSASLPLTTTFTIIGEPAHLQSRTVHLTGSSVVAPPRGDRRQTH
jgi:beta-glucosidase-like glycosyl hydrolase